MQSVPESFAVKCGGAGGSGGGRRDNQYIATCNPDIERAIQASACVRMRASDFAFARTKSDGPLLAHTTCAENNDKCTTTTY